MIRAAVGTLGAWFIALLIWIFGRTYREEEIEWLAGPVGGDYIGDRPYEETAEAEGLTLERGAREGGLVPDFDALAGPGFEPSAVDSRIRDFYEGTAGYRLDTWSTTYFPARLPLWLLVTTISRRVDQLNFPLEGLDTAYGMTSEIVLLRRGDGAVKYTGWYRKLKKTGRSIYTGFYTTREIPGSETPCVKVIFPMPKGNATVLLRPENDPDGGFRLESAGGGLGDAGFYRIARRRDGRLRVWLIKTLKERFQIYVDEDGVVRCDHHVRFLGLPVLSLHYRISAAPAASSAPAA